MLSQKTNKYSKITLMESTIIFLVQRYMYCDTLVIQFWVHCCSAYASMISLTLLVNLII